MRDGALAVGFAFVGACVVVLLVLNMGLEQPGASSRGYSRGYAAAVDSVRAAEDFANNGTFLHPHNYMMLDGMIDTGTTGDSVGWTQRGDYYGARVLGPRTVRVTRWTR